MVYKVTRPGSTLSHENIIHQSTLLWGKVGALEHIWWFRNHPLQVFLTPPICRAICVPSYLLPLELPKCWSHHCEGHRRPFCGYTMRYCDSERSVWFALEHSNNQASCQGGGGRGSFGSCFWGLSSTKIKDDTGRHFLCIDGRLAVLRLRNGGKNDPIL